MKLLLIYDKRQGKHCIKWLEVFYFFLNVLYLCRSEFGTCIIHFLLSEELLLFFARQVYCQWVYSTCLSEKVSPSLLNNFTGYRILSWLGFFVCVSQHFKILHSTFVDCMVSEEISDVILLWSLKDFCLLWLLRRFFLWFSTVWIWYSVADFGGHLSCLLFSWVSCTYVWH